MSDLGQDKIIADMLDNAGKVQYAKDNTPLKIKAHPKNMTCGSCNAKISFIHLEDWTGNKCVYCNGWIINIPWHRRLFIKIIDLIFVNRLPKTKWKFGKPLPDKIQPESFDGVLSNIKHK